MIMNPREATSKHKVKLTGYATMWRFDAEWGDNDDKGYG
jgi:hypothetical protein